MSIAQMFFKLSVRARVVALGLIPVIGFLATGRGARCFSSGARAPAVPAASHDLKSGLLTMRAATVDFVAHPSEREIKNFTDGQQIAMQSLDRIQATLAEQQQDVITPLRITVRDLKASFESLVNEQRALGFTESDGSTADLIWASSEVEKTIHNDLSWVADEQAAKLMVSIRTMRNHELE